MYKPKLLIHGLTWLGLFTALFRGDDDDCGLGYFP